MQNLGTGSEPSGPSAVSQVNDRWEAVLDPERGVPGDFGRDHLLEEESLSQQVQGRETWSPSDAFN